MALTEKLTAVGNAIRTKTGGTALLTLDEMPGAIGGIPTGERPSDWLPMPAPQDNELYLLFHIPEGASSLLAFTATCTGSYTVALGTVTGGAFVQQSAAEVASGAVYETELFADDWGSLTGDGFKQVMVRVSGTDILTWEPNAHSKKTGNLKSWNIMEICGKLPFATSVRPSNKTVADGLRKLRYFTLVGENNISDFSYMFTQCRGLHRVCQLDMSKATTARRMFYACYALTSGTLTMPSTCKDLTDLYGSCSNLTAVHNMVVPDMDYSDKTFISASSLESLTVCGDLSGYASGGYISIEGCRLGHTALCALLSSLPSDTLSASLLVLTNNPGVSELTDGEKAIATGKGWTLTL